MFAKLTGFTVNSGASMAGNTQHRSAAVNAIHCLFRNKSTQKHKQTSLWSVNGYHSKTELTVDKDFEVIFVNLATAAVGGLAVIAAGLALSDTTQSGTRHQRVRTPEHRTTQSPESANI